MSTTRRGTQDPDLSRFELYAYVGEDEHGSGEIGLKQGIVPAGKIALVAIPRNKLDRSAILSQLQRQINMYGKSIRLIRLQYTETVLRIDPD